MTTAPSKPSFMGNLSKFYGAILGAILAQLIVRWTGIDLHALGMQYEFSAIVIGLIDGAIMVGGGFIAGAITYLFPPNDPPPDNEDDQN